MLLPLVLPIPLLFISGGAVTILQSFGLMIPGSRPGLSYWGHTLNDPWIWISTIHTLWVAIISALISVFLGTILAWIIHRLTSPWHSIAALMCKLPLIFPHITVAYITALIFSQSGLLSSLAYQTGFINKSSSFFNFLYNGHNLGVFLAYIFKETPFVTLLVSGMLARLDENLITNAKILGASPLQIFTDIVIPHVHPAMLTSFLIISLYALGGFEIPWLIGESQPQLLPITIFNLYFRSDLSRRPEAAILLIIIMILSIIIIYISLKLFGEKLLHE